MAGLLTMLVLLFLLIDLYNALHRPCGGSPPADGCPCERGQGDPRHKLRSLNWTLIIGALLVGLMILLSIIGPSLAPQDPMKENYTLEVDGSIRTPPYPAFEIPGYPLGTDRFGRDLLSRILWGVRPTMIMVTVVAAFRLVVGILLGLIIGWAEDGVPAVSIRSSPPCCRCRF